MLRKAGRPKSIEGRQISFYIDKKNLHWLEDQVREGNFESISDGIRKCIASMRGKSGKNE